MTVELAVLVPVIVAVALVVANVLQFAELVSRFDRVAPDAVVLHGVSASGVSSELAGVAEVKSAIEQTMGEMPCEVAVRAEPSRAAARRHASTLPPEQRVSSASLATGHGPRPCRSRVWGSSCPSLSGMRGALWWIGFERRWSRERSGWRRL